MPVQPPRRPGVITKPVVAPKAPVSKPNPVSAPSRQPVRRDLPMAAPGAPSPLMNAVGQAGMPQQANTRPLIAQAGQAASMFGGGRAPQMQQPQGPGQFQRMSPGVYQGPNGQIVHSAMNPGNMQQNQRPMQPQLKPFQPVQGQMQSGMQPPQMSPGMQAGPGMPANAGQNQVMPWLQPGAKQATMGAFPQAGQPAGGQVQTQVQPGGAQFDANGSPMQQGTFAAQGIPGVGGSVYQGPSSADSSYTWQK